MREPLPPALESLRMSGGGGVAEQPATRAASTLREVLRTSLIERVREASDARLILIQAPAGFGKSTLLRQIAEDLGRHGARTAWVRLSPRDADVTRFLALLDRACDRLSPAGPPVGATEPCDPIAKLERIDGRALIVIDDLDHALTDEVAATLHQLVRQLPVGKQLLVASRTLPTLPISRLQLAGEALVLGSIDLRFDLCEATEVFGPAAGLSTEEIEALHSRTDGWPAALRFLKLALAKGRRPPANVLKTGLTPQLIDYLARDVLESQSPELRRCLLNVCFAERLTPGLVETLCTEHGGDCAIRAMIRAGLFLEPVEGSEETYAFHAVFRDYLLALAKRTLTAEEIEARHTAIARWHEANGRIEEAIPHAMEAGDLDRAVALFESVADKLVREERLGFIVTLVEQLPAERVRASSPILSAAIIAYGFRRRFREAHQLLDWREHDIAETAASQRERGEVAVLRAFVLAAEDRVDEFGRAGQEALTLVDSRDLFSQGVAINAYCYLLTARSQYEEAHDLLLKARAMHAAAANYFGRSYEEAILGSLMIAQGRLGEAIRSLTRALRDAESDVPVGSFAGAVIAAYLGDALYETGDSERAEALINAYLPIIEQQCIVDPLSIALLTLARIATHRGDVPQAHELIDRLITLGHRHGLVRAVTYGRAELARMATLAGDLERAGALLRTLGTDGASASERELFFHAGETEAQRITFARFLVHAGRTAEARAVLQAELRQAGLKRRVRRAIRLNVLLAMALDAEEKPAAARRAMMEALKLAAPGSFRRLLLDEGPRSVKILREMRAENLAHKHWWADDSITAYVDGLVGGTQAGEAAPSSDAAAHDGTPIVERPVQGLTERERDLLRFMADGYSNQDLADRLSVSANTVKWHLRNIYDKLGSRNRLQAVQAARHLGLID